jgi:hypothetical protein
MKQSKKIILSMAFLMTSQYLISAQPVYPGGGVALYRYNKNNDLEFLLVFDPAFSQNPIRVGFEFPGGKIGDPKNAAMDQVDVANPISFLKGAIREMLEELVFAPAVILGVTGQPYDMKSKSINPNFQQDAIRAFEQMIHHQSIFYIYKNQVDTRKPVGGVNQNAVFCLQMPSAVAKNLLEEVRKQREILTRHGFSFRRIGAEPNQFAWVKGTELLNLINNPSNSSVNAIQFWDENGKRDNVIIPVSKAFVGMIRDRVGQQDNAQPNEFCVDGKPSSMRAIIDHLLKNKPQAQPLNAQPVLQPKAKQQHSDDELINFVLQGLSDATLQEIESSVRKGKRTVNEVLAEVKSIAEDLKQEIISNGVACHLFENVIYEASERVKNLNKNRSMLERILELVKYLAQGR